MLRPGGRFLFFLNHPLLQAPGSGWIDDRILDEQYWRIGEYLVEDRSLQEVEKDIHIPFVHRPLSRYVNAMATAGLFVERMEEPAPPPGFLARADEYIGAATIPRLLFLRAENEGASVALSKGDVTEFLIITGLSGAGRSNAANTFEDLGWFVIDNLPPMLIGKVAELVRAPRLDHRTGGPGGRYRPPARISGRAARRDSDPAVDRRVCATLFLEASDEVLIRRYENTRRPHPLAAERVSEAIERERLALDPVKAEADVVVDTTDLNVHQLRDRLLDIFARDAEHDLQTNVVSFGFKHGVPLDVDMVFDCRFLPNPHWVDELRPLTGLDEPVREYVLGQPETEAFLAKVDDLLALLLPAFVKEGKSYLTIAVGCTGGRHRSVVIAEELARLLAKRGFEPTVQHRDVAR